MEDLGFLDGVQQILMRIREIMNSKDTTTEEKACKIHDQAVRLIDLTSDYIRKNSRRVKKYPENGR